MSSFKQTVGLEDRFNENGRIMENGTGSRIEILYTCSKEVHPRNICAEFQSNRSKTVGLDTL